MMEASKEGAVIRKRIDPHVLRTDATFPKSVTKSTVCLMTTCLNQRKKTAKLRGGRENDPKVLLRRVLRMSSQEPLLEET